MNFVFISLQRIGADRESTSTQLARELARQQHQVLYVNSPLDRKAIFRGSADPLEQAHLQQRRSGASPICELAPRLWCYSPRRVMDSFNWLPWTPAFTQLIRLNNQRLAQDIREATATLGFADYILVNDKDMFRGFYLKELLQPRYFLYLDRDYTVGMPYWQRHGSTLEPQLMAKADAVLCNSPAFTARALQYNPRSHYIGNGFDNRLFAAAANAPAPPELMALPPGPRIGYVGALITLRLDLELLTLLTQRRPDWQFVFIGWEDEAFAASALHTLPNAHFLGRRQFSDLPAFVRQFDVGINPQLQSPITDANFPLKVLEYLALGRAVVATATGFMREEFADHTYLADNAEEFEQQIARALAEDSPERQQARLDFVANFTWTRVVEKVLNVVHELQTVAAAAK